MASGDNSVTENTTPDFLRSFSQIDVDESDSDYDELSPIPETPGEHLEEDYRDAADGDPDASGSKVIPYKSVFDTPVPFSGQRENCWIPGVAIRVDIGLHERQPALKILNPNLYIITVKHGDFEWIIYRRYKHFRQLHDSLAFFLARYRVPLPNRDYHQRRATIMKDIKGHKKRQRDRQQKTVRLPKRPEALVAEDKLEIRMKQLKEYLENLLTCKSYRNHPETLKFFEVSHMSFVNKLGVKSKEGLIEKCSGGRRINIQCCGCLQNLHFAGTWNKRWLVVKDNFVMYIRPEDGHISDVLLMDSAFSVKCGLYLTGASHGVLIENFSRKLLIKCWTNRQAKEWAEQIQHVANMQACDYVQRNRFGSFAPARENTYARWFVDGRSYFEAVADALEKAKEEIYITDWWLSPEIYLKRPMVDGDKWRLDVILKRKAEKGVKVFVLLYKEIEAALTIKSIYSKQTLMAQCKENIKVLRHPDHIPGKGVLLWAHHEKLVIIDQNIAFTGGLDLCYGRWDDELHKMTDLGSISLKPKIDTPFSASDNNLHQEHSSHTELSVVTDDSISETGSWHVVYNVTPEIVVSEDKPAASSTDYQGRPNTKGKKSIEPNNAISSVTASPPHQPTRSKTPDQPGTSQSPGIQDSQPKESVSKHSISNQPIDANVVVKVTNASDDEGSDHDKVSRNSVYSNSSVGSSPKELQQPSVNFKYVKAEDTIPGTAFIDTIGFSDVALEEINQSMQPFKDIHNQSLRDRSAVTTSEIILNVPHNSVSVGFETLLDKEIICCAEAPDIPPSAKTKNASCSPSLKGKVRSHSSSPKRDRSPSASPRGKRRDKSDDRKSSSASTGVKASHLWKRRSKNKSLQLIIPSKNGVTKSSDGGGDVINENGIQSSEEIRSEKFSIKASKSLGHPRKDKNKLGAADNAKSRANSDSSGTGELMLSERLSLPVGAAASSKETPVMSATPSRAFSFSSTVGAMNALRKIMHRKEQNNNDGNDNVSVKSKEEQGNAARRRWKMILNVTKFESMVRTPQVPERVDESLFYNQNIKHPSTRSRLVKSFKEGVDKLKRQGRRDSGDEETLKADRNHYLQVPNVMHHTESEENILERGLLGSTKLWIGKDYVNFIYKDFVSLDQPFEDFIDRTKFTRMPWHDIGCVLYGKSARDLARHFIGRWNFTKLEKFKRNANFPLLIPKTTAKCSIPTSIKDITFEVKAQVLRSSCGWSAGIGQPESSIHEAYEHCIENAREFIYIENQFFITLVGNNSVVNNCIGTALYKRILRAHRSSSNFKVYVVMPLLPAFEGEFGTSTGVALQAVTHWNYSSICRGGNSLMERLAKEIPDPNKYIVFCGLRTWDKLNDKLMTELIYVHSKLMIVDDDTVIIGSANINDRSLLGTRDSEIAVIFEDIHKVDVTVNGKRYKAGKFASSLRWTIFREHLGIHNEPDFVDLTDISSDSFYKEVWIKRAAVNTKCFDEVFRCLPTDNVQSFAELRQYQSVLPLAQSNPEEAMNWLKKVKGYLVLLPLQFLRKENLSPKVGQKEALLPTQLWT